MPETTSPPASGKLTLRDAVNEFGNHLAARADDWRPQLPAHITQDRFRAVAVTAVNNNPDLLRADRLSLLNACCRAATDGLLPDGREGALVIFNTKQGDEWVKKVSWMPMVYGIIKKARQSGELSGLSARIVYQKELDEGRFKYRVLDGVDTVEHDPILVGERGPAVLVYATAVFKDGHKEIEPLHAADIAKMRAVSKAKSGPWNDWPDEMWKKSAIRRLAKRLPLSSELFDTIARDDELTEFERQKQEALTTTLRTAQAQLGAPVEDQHQSQPFDEPGAIEGESYEEERARYTEKESEQ